MRRFRNLVPMFAAVAALAVAAPAEADIGTAAEHAIIMDGETGQVLWAKDADTATPPASMSKLMTLELLFQRLKDGRVKLTDTFPVSQRAWSTQGSKMFVALNSQVPVEQLIRGIIIVSGNDACVVVAESLGGSVEHFADMMNARAKQLGLTNSHFVNPNGLPDPPGQLMSVHDLAILARHLIRDYPQYYHYFSERSFTETVEGGHTITQQNRDSVLDKFPGTDGLKTGHTDAAGYGITVSAVRNGQRLIVVLNGLRYPQLDKMTPAAQDWHGVNLRGDEAARVLGEGFREFRHYPLFKGDEQVGSAVVWQGTKDTVPLVTAQPVNVTMQVDSHSAMKVVLNYDGPVRAPIAKGQQIGTLNVTAPDFPGLKIPVYAGENVSSVGFFGRMFLGLKALVWGHSASK
ncbi:MAG TPA: D-alanyl-D-alanine carboxypeptidase family protein [Rhizomicrobium sp.]|nr:D-alanyl-D-alanine carboxypeptidase family protein [Rhizomicrobium sp.]